jgi:hypothetical protein
VRRLLEKLETGSWFWVMNEKETMLDRRLHRLSPISNRMRTLMEAGTISHLRQEQTLLFKSGACHTPV